MKCHALPVTLDLGACGAAASGALLFLLAMLGSTLPHARRTIAQQEPAVAAVIREPGRTGRSVAAGRR